MLFLMALACAPPDAAPPLRVAAAASLTDVLPRAATAWTTQTGQPVTFTFDASSRLATQLEAGAPFDVFVSADAAWMDWAAERDLIRTETRRDLLGNTLVVVIPEHATFTPSTPADLADPRIARLALGGERVPAGSYARAALRSAGVWDAVRYRVVNGDSVRTALGWVARGEADAGVVYATDAAVEPAVQVAFAFAPGRHPPVVYPAAVTKGGEDAAFLDFCAEGGRDIFEAAGFTVHPR